MRTVLLLLLAMLAVKTSTSIAVGQQACSTAYTGCLNKCVARPSKALQDNCMEACQTQNNACFSKVFGGPNPNTAVRQDAPAIAGPGAEPANPAPAAAALASDEQVKKPAKPTKTAKPAQQRERQERRPN
jgi:hypothetical protein